MRRLALLALLAACGRAPAEAPSFRDRSVPIASTTRGGPADLAGAWVVSAAYPGAGPRPGGRVEVRSAGGGLLWVLDGRAVATRPTAPGRYEGAGAPLWVLWADDGFRTAVVGTPDGSFGWVMDRPGAAAPDRAAAAREVLDFNGYDVGRLAP